jgi:hypothetical protein
MGLTKRRQIPGHSGTQALSGPSAPTVLPPQGSVRKGDTWASDEAGAWLRGEGDLLSAATGRPLALSVQLGVLAHASLERLRDLGRYSRRGSVRRAWGTDMAQLAGEVAHFGHTPEGLNRIQAELLVPLELDVLAGTRTFASRQEVAVFVRDRLPR